MAMRFRPRLWSTLAACAGIAATVSLGYWQLGRAEQKRALLAAEQLAASQPPVHIGADPVAADSVEGRKVEAEGRFEPRGLVLLDNRVREGQPGYEVIMPLELSRARYVLVNRGWIRAPADRAQLPAIVTPAGAVHVEGLAVVPGRRIFELSQQVPTGAVWQNLTIARYRERMPYPIQPVMIRQSNEVSDGLSRQWPTVERGIGVNQGYALQWFGMAVLIALIYLYYAFDRVAQKP
jgi:surfeit locus 1 family protein